jgi:hypothetical protein
VLFLYKMERFGSVCHQICMRVWNLLRGTHDCDRLCNGTLLTSSTYFTLRHAWWVKQIKFPKTMNNVHEFKTFLGKVVVKNNAETFISPIRLHGEVLSWIQDNSTLPYQPQANNYGWYLHLYLYTLNAPLCCIAATLRRAGNAVSWWRIHQKRINNLKAGTPRLLRRLATGLDVWSSDY